MAEHLREVTGIKALWSGAEHLEPVFTDNLHLSRVNDQYYLTFGQLRPSVEQPDNRSTAPISAEIRPMVQLIVSKDALGRIMALLSQALASDAEEK